jgi:Ca2+/Na+ antiporter
MDVRTTFLIGIAIIIVTMYYLEKEMEKEQIFWLYSGLGVLFGIASLYTVIKEIPSYDYYITFAVLFIVVAILYYDREDVEEAPKGRVKAKPKSKKKYRKKRKR